MDVKLLEFLISRSRAPIREVDLTAFLGRNVDVDALHHSALTLARGYQHGEINYELADSVINDLWAIFIDRAEGLPSPFWDIFEAFDAGEYRTSADRTNDPVAEFTDPMIAEILMRYPDEDHP